MGNQSSTLLGQLGSVATGGISSLIGAGLGLGLQSEQDSNQLNQQAGLDAINNQYAEQLSQFNYGQQMQMWNATNYGPQVKQMEEAGLNPALMYAKGGAGGTTQVNNASAPQSQAPNAQGSVLGVMNMQAQNEEIQSQVKLNNALAAKAQGETPTTPENNLGDVQAAVAKAQVPKIQADTANTEANTALTQINTQLAQIQTQIQGQSAEAQVQTLQVAAQKSVEQLVSLTAQAKIDQTTANTKIQQIGANLIGTYLNNRLTTAQTGLTNQQTDTSKTQATLNTKNTQLSDAQITNVQQQAEATFNNALSNTQNADTNSMNLAFQKLLHDTPDGQKMALEMTQFLLPLLKKGNTTMIAPTINQ